MTWFYFLTIPSYLIGMIPNSVYVAKLAGHDIYNEGSKNPGASNVARIAGWKWGALAMFLDAFKGFLPTFLVLISLNNFLASEQARFIAYLCAIAAVLGHVAPIKRKGGKGVATSGGAALALYPIGGVAVVVIWAIAMKAIKLPVVSSLLSMAFFALWVNFSFYYIWEVFIVFALLILLILRHLPNLKRLINGNETKVLKNKEPT